MAGSDALAIKKRPGGVLFESSGIPLGSSQFLRAKMMVGAKRPAARFCRAPAIMKN